MLIDTRAPDGRRRHDRTLQVLVAGVGGLLAAVLGLAVWAPRLALEGPSAAALAGTLLGVAGIVAVGLALRLALRGTRTRTKLLALLGVLILLQWIAVPALNAGLATNAPRDDVPSAAALGLAGARDVSFRAGDGTRLAGWYVPRQTRGTVSAPPGAAVLLLHGSHDDRSDTLAHLRMLARAGYGVLALDARGHGASAGRTNALGWAGTDDIAGALAFVRRQPEVDPGRIAALGLSMGAEEALRAAADGIALRVIVADGAGASTTGDARLTAGGVLPTSVTWTTMHAVELLSGDDEPPPLRDRVASIHAPVLLIASNADGELAIDRAYAERIGPRRSCGTSPTPATRERSRSIRASTSCA
jgi:pimeloyl-ACP methyl ester carboxylesterase